MLSYKITYAIQILDLLSRNKRGVSLMVIRNQFLFLPSKTFISEIVKQLEAGRLICNAIPYGGTKYYIMTNLYDISLKDLVNVIHDDLVFDTHVGFAYWQAGFLKSHPNIKPFEQGLEKRLMDFIQSVTIGELLEEGKPKTTVTKNKLGKIIKNNETTRIT